MDGAGAVLDGILHPYPDKDLSIFVVWIAIKDSDTFESARKAADTFPRNRVKQFFDPKQLVGRAIAECLGHQGGIAWDFYLFYPPGSRWRKRPPQPELYMHQLANKWADPGRLFEKKQLMKKLSTTMMELFP